MRLEQKHPCPHCYCKNTVKNGKTYYGKQNYKCKSCRRQFVERDDNPFDHYAESLIGALLLERISLRGIGRVLGKSLSWIYHRMKPLWECLPDELPTGGLESAEISLLCLEADEMWSFVGAKDCPEWIWLAIERRTRLVAGFHVGGRDEEGAKGLLLDIPDRILEKSLIFSDDLPSYTAAVPKGQLQQEGKGQTTKIERINNTIRQRCSRLVRKSLSFSKKWENHYFAIKYFLVNYNLDILAKNASLYK